MSKKLLSLHGLKFNPFSAQVPTEALWTSPPVESFCWRIEHQIGEGGFALATGEPGTGKSAALRLLAARLTRVRDLAVGVLSRPQASLADFYRELGHLFNVPLSPHNRWASARVLREKWLQHQEAALVRPVLLVDEAQEMAAAVFSELRLLSSAVTAHGKLTGFAHGRLPTWREARAVSFPFQGGSFWGFRAGVIPRRASEQRLRGRLAPRPRVVVGGRQGSASALSPSPVGHRSSPCARGAGAGWRGAGRS